MDKCMHVDGFIVEPEKYSDDFLRLWSRKQLRCQQCGGAVYYRHGSRVKPHFAHVAKTRCEYSEPETLEHIMGKKLLKTWIEMTYPSNVTRQEYYLEEINQRADIITVFPNGHRLCIEFQCSPISERILKRRIDGYESINVSQVWILGYSLFTEIASYRFRLLAWQDMIQRQQNKMLYLLDSLESECMFTLARVTAQRDRKTIFTCEKITRRALMEHRMSHEGSISLVNTSYLWKQKSTMRDFASREIKISKQIEKTPYLQQLIHRRGEEFLSNPLRQFAISRIGDYLSHPVMNQKIAGDHLFDIDHRLWQSFLFLTEIHKVYQRRSSYGTHKQVPKLIIKHILERDVRFPERPFRIVLKKYVKHELAHYLRDNRTEFLHVKMIHEVIYEYFCRLEYLGFLRNITPEHEYITPEGKYFGKFEVRFDRFCPELFGKTETEIKEFFRIHSLCYIRNRWFDCKTNRKIPLL
ncbi:hypothetical protein BRE01_20540 [Brevibacillus reuszeri]|uniref:Competence protein CoiA n=2 Tax=Brevibacillus reuszeri TaxID=54915 RepID=A0ABQ0TLU8_9BACL|nr:competence protein CoiA family protein [Brevibacillus reuszeri]MED1856899.1 competence protein CoiA family protein [Brevibacillus reuszeri]GED68352.1 hypothetical protein BRE01_20540 [Brevibacillus reuszeri]